MNLDAMVAMRPWTRVDGKEMFLASAVRILRVKSEGGGELLEKRFSEKKGLHFGYSLTSNNS
jgi:hypothetical protein